MGRWVRLGLLLAWCTACATLRSTLATPPLSGAVPIDALRVPYVSQSELLCGGAAIAMIERWWGRRGVYAEDFSYLVRPDSGGILTTDMLAVMRARHWAAQAFASSERAVRQAIADSVPVLALIRVAAKRYHYVVVVAWSDSAVTFHDPAAAPWVTLRNRDFTQRWAGARQWAMFVRPLATTASAPSPAPPSVDSATIAPPPAAALPCQPFLDQAVDAAAGNRLADAERFLNAARAACPTESLVLRELAGVRFRQGAHGDAAALSDEYTRIVPADSLGWQLLASSRYLTRDAIGALRAWNRVGRPPVDLLQIDGGRRTRYATLADAIHLMPGAMLTPPRLALAQRRLADVPTLLQSRVTYVPVTGGAVEVRAAVVERARVDPLAQLLVVEASRAVATRQIFANVSAPLGLGDLWTVHWRWRPADPRVALRVDIPTHIVAPGVMRFERSWEAFRFSDGVTDEQRSMSAASLGGWVHPAVEWRVGARYEAWSGSRAFVTATAGSAVHLADDHLSLMVDADRGVPINRSAAFHRVSSRISWELPTDMWSNTWSLRLGGDWNSAATPQGLWPIAGGGLMRAIPLRAHPLIINNRLPSSRIGQRVVHGGIAGDRQVGTVGRLQLGAGVFLDAAQVGAPARDLGRSRTYLDAGAGIIARVANVPWAAARIDLARGVTTDRRWGITAAFLQTLPVRLARPR